jgi:hypothetical protein
MNHNGCSFLFLSGFVVTALPVWASTPATPMVASDDAWRATPPTAGPEPSFTPPHIDTFKIDGTDVGVQLIERHELPIVELSMVIRGGRMLDAPNKAGMWSLCLDLLDESTVATLDESVRQATEPFFPTGTMCFPAEVLVVAGTTAPH